ncbi:MAG: DUF11 domain-containing protein, partial [Candidatus Altiarchaeum hamiconexum]|nr:DUF11 domain-containing protein [Candidatus Altarchaeum hamiconexum]
MSQTIIKCVDDFDNFSENTKNKSCAKENINQNKMYKKRVNNNKRIDDIGLFLFSIFLISLIGMFLVGDVAAYATTLNKTADKTTACGGDIVNYTIGITTVYVANDFTGSDCTAGQTTCDCIASPHNLIITDNLPWGDSNYVSSTYDGNPTNPITSNNTWNVTIPGASVSSTCGTASCVCTGILTATVTDTLTITTKVSDNGGGQGCTNVSAGYSCNNTANCSSDSGGTLCTPGTTLTLFTKPQLLVTKTQLAQNASPGDKINFTINVSTNVSVSSCPAINAYIRDQLDDKLEYVGSSSVFCTNNTGVIDCGLGNISSSSGGKSVTLTVKVKEDTPNGATIQNNANASADNADTATSTNATVTVTAPTLSVTKTCLPATVGTGEEINCTITVTSLLGNAKNVNITDHLPTGFIYINSNSIELLGATRTSTINPVQGNTGDISFGLWDIPQSGIVNLTITLNASDIAGNYNNSVEANSSNGGYGEGSFYPIVV